MQQLRPHHSPLIILSSTENPITTSFSRFCASHGITTWQPNCLEEFGCALSIDGPDRMLTFRKRGELSLDRINPAGLLFQSVPPVSTGQEFSDRDRAYSESEFGSLIKAVWNTSERPALGLPDSSCPSDVYESGPEARISLRRLGIPVLADRIGTLLSIRELLIPTQFDCTRVTKLNGGDSSWLSELTTSAPSLSDAPIVDNDLIVATTTDRRTVVVAIHVDLDVLALELGPGGMLRPIPPEERSDALLAVVMSVVEATRSRFGCVYAAVQDQQWKVARLSLQLPYWLSGYIENWLSPRLAAVFTGDDEK